nr:ribonuclease H-like domain-containing protein [Tanacetum cinerariifolium]
MQKRKNDVKARTTLLLSLPDEQQFRFSKYKTAQELWVTILKTFSGNEATKKKKKKKKNILKQQYGNFKAEGLKTLEETFNRLGNKEVNTASVSTASTNVPTARANIRVDINQIDEDDIEEMDIKWNMALLSMRANKLWKKTGKKISIQGTDVAGAPRSQDRGRRDNYRQGSKVKEYALKVLMAIDEVGWDWSYMANNEENHALVVDKEAPTEFSLMANTSVKSKELETLKKEKEGLDGKLAGFQTASKDLDSLLKSQRLDKNKEGLGYSVVPPLPAQIYSSSKKDMSWTGLPEFKDDIVTNYSRPAPTIESSPDDAQNRNPSVTKTEASSSTISPKSFIKFVKAKDSPTNSKTAKAETAKAETAKAETAKAETAKKPPVKKFPTGGTKFSTVDMGKKGKAGSSQNNIDDKGYWDSGCSRHMTECIMLGQNFKLLDDDNVLLRTHRQHNMYSIDLNDIVPHKDLTCLVAKASADKCMLSHRRLGHLNFKTMNKLVRHNLVRGLPTKCFENGHTCTACLKGKQHKASCKSKLVNSISKPLHTLHMDLFGHTFKGIKREFSNARIPQQNGVAERRNRTLIEAARTMLADAKLPVTFWA